MNFKNLIYRGLKSVQRNASIYILAFIVIIISSVLILYTYINDSEIYKTVVFRVAVFFLGSIVTINVYIYSKMEKISPIQFTFTGRSKWMLVGVITSFLLLFTMPSTLYYPDPFFQNYLVLIEEVEWNWDMGLAWINLLSLLISTSIFILSFILFVSSFNIKRLIQKSCNNILKKTPILNELFEKNNNLKEFQKQKSQIVVEISKLETATEDLNIKQSKLKEIESKINNIHKSKTELFGKIWDENDLKVLNKDLDVYVNHLCYLLDLNHNEFIDDFLSEWTKMCNNIQSYIYNAEHLNDEYEKLYLKTLHLTKKLIDKTFNEVSHEKYFEISLNTLLEALPIFEEDLIEENKNTYRKNYNKLSKVYYKELLNVIEHIYFDNKYTELLNKLLYNQRFNFKVIENNSFLNNNAKVSIEMEHYGEYLLLGMLYKCIKENANADLPVLMALIMKSQEIKIKNSSKLVTQTTFQTAQKMKEIFGKAVETSREQSKSGTGNVGKTRKKSKKGNIGNEGNTLSNWVDSTKQVETKFTKENLKLIVIIIVKACEIENYKAVGYLVKRLCDSFERTDQLVEVINELKEEIKVTNKYNLQVINISLNEYSLDYCFSKAVFLLILQLKYRYKSEIEFKTYISNKYEKSILDSIKEKHKEYNLYCIHNEHLKSLKLIASE